MRAFSLFVLAAFATTLQAQVLEVSGATTVQKRILEPGATALMNATGIVLKIHGPGTGKGMLALIEKSVPVAAAGEALEDAVASAKKAAADAGKTIAIPDNLVYHAVASDNIVFAIHASNPLATLTPAEVKAILTGKMANWKEVKGPDLPIKVFVPAQGQAVRTLVEKQILGGVPFVSGATEAKTALEQLTMTAANPGAIAPYSEAVIKESGDKLKALKGTVIGRPLGFVTIGSPTPETKRMIDFFRSAEGKKTIR
jgi:phosphate transport system substrate-binding protein